MFAAFIVVMLYIGIYSRRKATNIKDFYLAGRNLGPWLSSFAYGTTYFSAVIFVGYAGAIGWNYGMGTLLIAFGNAFLGGMLAWLLLAKRARSMTQRLDAATMPNFLEKRYGSKHFRIVSALIIFIFLVPYTASVYTGIGYLFEKAFRIPFEYCMILMAALTAMYVFFGGYFATALTDFVQGIIMIAGVVILGFVIINSPPVGGLSNGLAELGDKASPLFPFTNAQKGWGIIWLVLLTSLGTWGLPQMTHKFYTIRDNAAIKRAIVITTVFALIIAGGAYFIGGLGRLFIAANEAGLPTVAGKTIGYDMIIPNILTSSFIPSWLLGLIIILVLSASMSTLASLILISSSAISMDLVKGVMFPKMDTKKVHLIMRIMCAVFALASLIIAVKKPAPIINLMSLSWGAVAGAFIGPFVWGLFWKGTTRAGAWAGIFSGLITVVVLNYIDVILNIKKLPEQTPMAGAIAMIVSLLIVPLVSLFTKKLSKEKIEECFGDN